MRAEEYEEGVAVSARTELQLEVIRKRSAFAKREFIVLLMSHELMLSECVFDTAEGRSGVGNRRNNLVGKNEADAEGIPSVSLSGGPQDNVFKTMQYQSCKTTH